MALSDNKRLVRIAQRSLRVILSPRNYYQDRRGIDLGYKLELAGGTAYPKPKAKEAFFAVVREIAKTTPAEFLSSDAIYRAVKASLEQAIDANATDATTWLDAAEAALGAFNGSHRFWYPIGGLKLVDLAELDLGPVQLRVFHQDELGALAPDSDSGVGTVIINKLEGMLVLTGMAIGDARRAQAYFEETCELALSIIRFIVADSFERGFTAKYIKSRFRDS